VISKPYTLTLALSLKGEGINGWTLVNAHPENPYFWVDSAEQWEIISNHVFH
jgi:hypothetical protein